MPPVIQQKREYLKTANYMIKNLPASFCSCQLHSEESQAFMRT